MSTKHTQPAHKPAHVSDTPAAQDAHTSHEKPKEAGVEKDVIAEADANALTKADLEKIDELSKDKVSQGLPLDQARVSAEAQVREDKAKTFEKVRAAISPPKKAGGNETAKA